MPNFYSTLTQSSVAPKGYLKVIAPNEYIARMVSKIKLGKFWAFIYKEKQFRGQVEKYGLYPIEISPIEVKKSEVPYWKEKFKEYMKDEKHKQT